ncbi:MAG TPA: hypothetical protein PL009_12960 [Flavipsychrobacter sp.]|nr:hypothetical protein [Flavipsychrobacter sp.]
MRLVLFIRLLLPIQIPGDQLGTVAAYAGESPRGLTGAGDFIDWQGMNVILEYGNPHTNLCDLRDYAQAWLDLSDYTLGSSSYNTALEAITHEVIDANVATGKPNGSALNQLRTNERLFQPSISVPFPNGVQLWQESDWELSQFELNGSSHLLAPAPVTNTPVNEANMGTNLSGQILAGTGSWGAGIEALIDWSFKSKLKLKQGFHNLPLNYTYNGDVLKQAATARIDAEQLHFWDFNWSNNSTTFYTYISPSNPNSHNYEKDLRQQLSLNTCQGCHAGETKTMFTQMTPVGYGESHNYWGTIPANDYRRLIQDSCQQAESHFIIRR